MDALADVARALHAEPTTDLVLEAACRAALVTVPDCAYAEVTSRRGSVLATAGLRLVQALPGGLVDDAWSRRVPVRTPDGRYLAVPIWFGDSTVGVLGLTASPQFDDAAVETASALATHAALACARALSAQRLRHVQTALQTNRGIAIAIGIVMARGQMSQDDAFEVLRTASQRENRKLRDVAEDVVRTGQLPDPALVAGQA